MGEVFIVVAGLLLATIMFFASKNALNLSVYYAPLIHVATQLSLELSYAGDTQNALHIIHQDDKANPILSHLKSALRYANTMLDGGDDNGYQVLRIDDEHQSQKIQKIKTNIIEFMTLMENRSAHPDNVPDSEDVLIPEVNALLNVIASEIKLVEVDLTKEFFKNIKKFQTARVYIISLVIIFSMVSAFGYRYFRQRKLESEQTVRKSLDLYQRSQDQLQNVINGANLGYWDWNYQTGEHSVNDRWLEILGLERSDIKNHVDDWGSRIHPDDKQRVLDTVDQYISIGKSYVSEFRMKHKDGHWVWIQGSGAVVEYDSEHKALRLCGTHQDITDRKMLEKHLNYLATHDQLTKLYNRRVFEERLADEIKRSERYDSTLAVFLLDIDYFKEVNDSHGHEAGDTVLKEFAAMLRDRLRINDITARYGGEEFAVVLPETTATKATELAERFRQQVSLRNIEISGGKKISLTISIGIASYPENGESVEHLINAADKAMYNAKNGGRNKVVEAD
ncbi:MAG: sensor domain-containing diguanylate cyclase [Gammaproteobacteria bacterium]|nr:sensor domain-containing diguanylate cyclase [Gammaproteobacteria bacterium]